jgi:hypothetical protein
MRPVDHYFSILTKLECSLAVIDPEAAALKPGAPAAGEFVRLCTPVIGAEAAVDLYYRTIEGLGGQSPENLNKLGFTAAFLLGEYDESSMTLEDSDWQNIRDTIEDVSEEIDLNTLTDLMNSLLTRGLL